MHRFSKRVFAVILCLVACAGSQSGSAFADDIIRVFLFAGQSNMVGADAHADRIDEFPDAPGFERLINDQDRVLYRCSLGGGVQESSGWEP